MASHCLIFLVFPTVFSLQPIYLNKYFFLILAWGGKGKGEKKEWGKRGSGNGEAGTGRAGQVKVIADSS
jgi:hypothetical protein